MVAICDLFYIIARERDEKQQILMQTLLMD